MSDKIGGRRDHVFPSTVVSKTTQNEQVRPEAVLTSTSPVLTNAPKGSPVAPTTSGHLPISSGYLVKTDEGVYGKLPVFIPLNDGRQTSARKDGELDVNSRRWMFEQVDPLKSRSDLIYETIPSIGAEDKKISDDKIPRGQKGNAPMPPSKDRTGQKSTGPQSPPVEGATTNPNVRGQTVPTTPVRIESGGSRVTDGNALRPQFGVIAPNNTNMKRKALEQLNLLSPIPASDRLDKGGPPRPPGKPLVQLRPGDAKDQKHVGFLNLPPEGGNNDVTEEMPSTRLPNSGAPSVNTLFDTAVDSKESERPESVAHKRDAPPSAPAEIERARNKDKISEKEFTFCFAAPSAVGKKSPVEYKMKFSVEEIQGSAKHTKVATLNLTDKSIKHLPPDLIAQSMLLIESALVAQHVVRIRFKNTSGAMKNSLARSVPNSPIKNGRVSISLSELHNAMQSVIAGPR